MFIIVGIETHGKYRETSLWWTPSEPQNSVRYREVSATNRFFPKWLIPLQKPVLGRWGIVQSTPKCVKRPALEEQRA